MTKRKAPKVIITFDDAGNPQIDEKNLTPHHRQRVIAVYRWIEMRDACLSALLEPTQGLPALVSRLELTDEKLYSFGRRYMRVLSQTPEFQQLLRGELKPPETEDAG